MPEKTLLAPPRRAVKRTRWIVLAWLVAAISVGAMAIAGPCGWDVLQCWTAVQSVGHGGSPYADGIAAVKAYHDRPLHTAGDHAPIIFMYPPLIIPIMRLLARYPGWILGPLYGCALAVGFFFQLRAGYQMAAEKERHWLIFLLPFAAFFPGLITDIAIVSGNVAYILYGLVLAAAVPGWKRNQWIWFYAAVIVASIFKAPMLTLLAFPLLVGRRQWIPAGIAATAGCLLFAIQPLLWPAQFKEFLLAVHADFSGANDLGFGPAGIVGQLLQKIHKPYSLASTIAYGFWAVALGALLLAISSRVRRKPSLRELWIPVAFMGTILLNPRIKPYDNAALTVPMLLISWRALQMGVQGLADWKARRAFRQNPAITASRPQRKDATKWAQILLGVGLFVAFNAFDNLPWSAHISVESMILLTVFVPGIYSLRSTSGNGSPLSV